MRKLMHRIKHLLEIIGHAHAGAAVTDAQAGRQL